ncbi:hypothetical protein C2845_PM08G27270 [Panicum miliaceum]|uniref:Late embryogenesis abundant protein LEA-2 subgroup domain-containing protein n=1 Tax=Panicum miliaceum TaxID=4540 RepID=A0A3L6QZP1_PANMI|nr:hypothetical protein C2845_PM08G27270 [Panicum miliaceum]
MEGEVERRRGHRLRRRADAVVADEVERHLPVLWCLTCAILVGFGVFMVHIFERALYQAPEFKATVSAYEGLDAPAAGAGTAPSFRVALHVGNELSRRPFCAERGAVAVSYAGVPLARPALPGFCVSGGGGGVSLPVVAAGEGMRGVPAGLRLRMEEQRQRRERVPLSVQVTMEKFTGRSAAPAPMLVWCRAMLDGQPVWPPSLYPRFSIVDAEHVLDGWNGGPTIVTPSIK